MDSSDVPDSTDWLGTPLAGLMQVEQAFRCHVCKDLYNSPMLTSCSHTFCSLCIRRSLSVDGKCPLCRADDQENRLRGNWALREAVDAFSAVRSAILGVGRGLASAAAAPPVSTATTSSPTSPKRKTRDDIEDEDGDRKRIRMSTRRSKTRAAEATAAMMREEADVVEASDRENMEYIPDDGLVACPICWKRMKPLQVDKHIDTSCPGAPQEDSTPARPNGATSRSSRSSLRIASSSSATTQQPAKPPPERLPPLNYSMLNDQALRKKLSALGLSTSGGRQLLERRHKEWVTLWNANCDSARPKRRAELLQDLAVWERTVGAPAPSRSSAIGAQIRDKDFDGEAWAAKHESSFKDLIANARRTRSKAKQQGPSGPAATGEEVPKPDSGSDPAGAPTIVDDYHSRGWGQEQSKTDCVVDLSSPAPATPSASNHSATLETRNHDLALINQDGRISAAVQDGNSEEARI